MEEGGDINQRPFPAPESSENIPLLTVPVPARSLYHEYHPLIRPMLIGNIIGGHATDDQNVTYSQVLSLLPYRSELQSPPLPPPPATSSMLLPMIESSGGFEKGESSGTKRRFDPVEVPPTDQNTEASTNRQAEMEQKRKQDGDDRPPERQPRTRRRRSPHVHNLSERTRRHRITEKVRTLQELIPNCNKTDKASVLSDAIEYIKNLQQQVQMMSMYQRMPVPSCSSFLPMRPMMGMGHGMGMRSIDGTGFTVVPPSGMNPLGESGFLPVPQLQFPVHSTSQPNQATISIGITSATASTSATGLSSTYTHGESSSQSVPRYGSDFYHIPRTHPVRRPQGLIPMVQASLIVRTQPFSSSLADEIFQVDEEVHKFHHD